MDTARAIQRASRALSHQVGELVFSPPVTHVYNPLDYAGRCHAEYVRRFAAGPKRVVFLGMNPGPYGMSQTGVPFGEIGWVRDWMGIHRKVGKPRIEHPKRPVLGFACARSEVSGRRLWSAVAEQFTTPEQFFRSHYIANYCPLVFMEASGRNFTPDKLPARERDPLFERCDDHLRRIVRILDPEWVIGIGAFAKKRAAAALDDPTRKIAAILHPSPANPRANANWIGEVRAQLKELGLCDPPSERPGEVGIPDQ